MTVRAAEPTDSPEKRRPVWSCLRRAVLWFAALNFWVTVGGLVILGLIAMQTEQFDSLAVLFFLLAGILPVIFQTIETYEEPHGYAYDTSVLAVLTGGTHCIEVSSHNRSRSDQPLGR